jgi:hypothetical protein
VFLRRLTNQEYGHTVSDLLSLATVLDPEATFEFPADTAAGGFRNNAENGTISTAHVERYNAAASQLVSDLLQSSSRRAAVVGCDVTASSGASCLSTFLQRFGRRAYRRPLRADEVSGLTALAATAAGDADPWAGVSLAMQAMLQSSDFLYRIEIGTPDPKRAGVVQLTGYEVATRLSYLLWGTAPDDGLLDGAGAGKLDTADGVKAQARQMLGDPRARAAMQDFYLQWLQVDSLDQATPDPALFPAWNAGLQAAMRDETVQFTDDLIWRDGASFLDVLGGGYTYANPTLAAFYGLPAPSGASSARLSLPAGSPRGGFLTQASFLTVTSRPERTSPTVRGRYIRETLLCDKLPDPPANVNTTLPPMPGLSLRQRLAQHATDPACAGCHTYMDPVGLALEQYDAIGAFHATDAQGQTIDASGQLVGFTPPDFVGPHGLEQLILSTSAFPRCTALHMFRYAFARRETADDQCTADQFYIALRDSGYSVREMIASLTASDAFRFRQMGGSQ